MVLCWQEVITGSFSSHWAKGPQAMCEGCFFHGFSFVKSWFLRKMLLLGGPLLVNI